MPKPVYYAATAAELRRAALRVQGMKMERCRGDRTIASSRVWSVLAEPRTRGDSCACSGPRDAAFAALTGETACPTKPASSTGQNVETPDAAIAACPRGSSCGGIQDRKGASSAAALEFDAGAARTGGSARGLRAAGLGLICKERFWQLLQEQLALGAG